MDTQSDTRVGDLPLVAGEDLTGMEGRLAELGIKEGKPVVYLPASRSDYPAFVIVEGAGAGETVAVRPLEPGRNVRLRLSGTCDCGDPLVPADPADPLTRGAVSTATTTGTYRGVAIAEENGVDGQWVLARPMGIGLITID